MKLNAKITPNDANFILNTNLSVRYSMKEEKDDFGELAKIALTKKKRVKKKKKKKRHSPTALTLI
ncbi:hypothetical protein T02_3657 [Trichinella nativa]|uniref:Uncharacterized protein n=1 Tax=Trichinella nativa TaxID=6335 RepID=A0A0V1LHM7_9BILA|nr:hypothetical protein T02_3657 [Trichinella nativa]